jgi:8-oxo-dGTP pyrophosphatase MutT (NUDIX family)
MLWKPNVTVAAIIEQDGRFLMVEERCEGRTVFNQPAGHLEKHESPQSAVVRETLEETGYAFTPTHITGIYQSENPAADISYLRICFTGRYIAPDNMPVLDADIIRSLWMTTAELKQSLASHRSPMVMKSTEDYLAGIRYPLELIKRLI